MKYHFHIALFATLLTACGAPVSPAFDEEPDAQAPADDAADAPFVDAGDAVTVIDSTPLDSTPLDTTTSTDTSPPPPPPDTGCTPHGHFDPVAGEPYASCLPAGVPGDPGTYPAALLDAELARADATPGPAWGAPEAVWCGAGPAAAPCVARTRGAGGAYWCAAGPLAGYYVAMLVCPTDPAFRRAWW